MAVRNRFSQLHSEIRGWRRELHANPELQFDTFKTSEFVEGKLREFGCDEIATGIGRTGVVGIINGRETGSGRTVGLRADMDALPIHEATGLEYASVTNGVMHACGHDGHTSMLLGAAKYLAETRNFNGRIALIFQPAEEGGGGGKEMVDDGLMDDFGIGEVYGMHNMPGLEPDEFAIRSGPFFAAADTFAIDVEGQGGHAAKPHAALDPTVAAAHMVLALQSIVSRNVDPKSSLVVSVTSFRTETDAFNVIPGKVGLKGTVRSFEDSVAALAEDRIREIATKTAAAFSLVSQVEYMKGYPVMANSPTETGFAGEAAMRVTGKLNDCMEQIMGAEDFAFMLNARPGAYICVGNGDSSPLHHEKYDFNDETIPSGCSWWVEIAESRLPLS